MFETLTRGLMRPNWGMDKVGTQLGYTLGGGYEAERAKIREEEAKKKALQDAMASAMAMGGSKNGMMSGAAAVASQMGVDPIKVAQAFQIGRQEMDASIARDAAAEQKANEQRVVERLLARPEYSTYKDMGITDLSTLQTIRQEDRNAAADEMAAEKFDMLKQRNADERARLEADDALKQRMGLVMGKVAQGIQQTINSMPEAEREYFNSLYGASLKYPEILTPAELRGIQEKVASGRRVSLPPAVTDDMDRLMKDDGFRLAFSDWNSATGSAVAPAREALMKEAKAAYGRLDKGGSKADTMQGALDLVLELKKAGGDFTGLYGPIDQFNALNTPDQEYANAQRERLTSILELAARGQLKGQGPVTDSDAKVIRSAQTLLDNRGIWGSDALKELDRLEEWLKGLGVEPTQDKKGEKDANYYLDIAEKRGRNGNTR